MHHSFLPLVTSALVGLALVSCGGSDDWSIDAVAKGEDGVTAAVVNSQPAVGPMRLAFGLFTKDGGLVQDAKGRVQLVHIKAGKAVPSGEYELRAVTLRENATHLHPDGQNHLHNDPVATMYVAQVQLTKPEEWGAKLLVNAGGKKYTHLRTRFFVLAQSTVPPISAAAPKTKQPVLRDVSSINEIDSSNPPRPELHSLTVADAIDSGKPSIVAFATPAFCQTRFCGPVVDDVVAPLAKDYAGRANFIHIEPYNLADARKGKLVPIPQLDEWGLQSEPYLFVLDAKGRVSATFEGIAERAEVAAALDAVLAGR